MNYTSNNVEVQMESAHSFILCSVHVFWRKICRLDLNDYTVLSAAVRIHQKPHKWKEGPLWTFLNDLMLVMTQNATLEFNILTCN